MLEQWSHWYTSSAAVSTAVGFGHLSGLLLGGGSAIAADLATLRRTTMSIKWRMFHLSDLKTVHLMVLVGLGLTVVTGALMVAADLATFMGSVVFWIKMVLLLGLLGNGGFLARSDWALRTGRIDEARGWRRLRVAARVSLVLWFVLLLLGFLLRVQSPLAAVGRTVG